MTLFDLLLPVFLIGMVIWLLRKPKNTNIRPSNHDDGLTETQRRWRQMKLEEFSNANVSGLDSSETDYLAKVYGPEEAKKICLEIEKGMYIKENMRPFKFAEWLVYQMPPELTTNYTSRILIFILGLGILFPMFLFGAPLSGLLLFIMYIWIDINFYRVVRIYEVSIWNPEYLKKYGNQ